MQGYKVKEKTAIVPPVSKLSGHPGSKFLGQSSITGNYFIFTDYFKAYDIKNIC
jgi:hypothetical protein